MQVEHYVVSSQTFRAISEWCQALHHMVYGPEEGERRYRAMRLKTAIELWTTYRKSELN